MVTEHALSRRDRFVFVFFPTSFDFVSSRTRPLTHAEAGTINELKDHLEEAMSPRDLTPRTPMSTRSSIMDANVNLQKELAYAKQENTRLQQQLSDAVAELERSRAEEEALRARLDDLKQSYSITPRMVFCLSPHSFLRSHSSSCLVAFRAVEI